VFAEESPVVGTAVAAAIEECKERIGLRAGMVLGPGWEQSYIAAGTVRLNRAGHSVQAVQAVP